VDAEATCCGGAIAAGAVARFRGADAEGRSAAVGIDAVLVSEAMGCTLAIAGGAVAVAASVCADGADALAAGEGTLADPPARAATNTAPTSAGAPSPAATSHGQRRGDA
jgi:hypothetical protein